MDIDTYKQFQELIETINNLTERIRALEQITHEDQIIQFYETEIESEEGQLRHLRDDKTLKHYIAELDEERATEEETESIADKYGREEYRQ